MERFQFNYNTTQQVHLKHNHSQLRADRRKITIQQLTLIRAANLTLQALMQEQHRRIQTWRPMSS